MLPIGIIYFTLMVNLIALGGSFSDSQIATVVLLAMGIPVQVIQTHNYVWTISDPAAVLISLALACLGVVIVTGSMHLARFVGSIHGKFAKALLVSD
jgi:integral membrane sensor domain MASE1